MPIELLAENQFSIATVVKSYLSIEVTT